jgi:hypothetical protein
VLDSDRKSSIKIIVVITLNHDLFYDPNANRGAFLELNVICAPLVNKDGGV